MRKTIYSFAIAALLFSLSACGGGGTPLLTEDEVSQRVDQITADSIASLEPTLDQECEDMFDALVQVKVDSIVAANTIEEED